MKIRNICGKIINLGTLTLLPEEVAELPAEFEYNPVVKHFADMGLVEFEDGCKPANVHDAKSQQLSNFSGDNEPDKDADWGDDNGDNGDNGEQEPDDGKGEAEPHSATEEDDNEPDSQPSEVKTGRGRNRNK